MGRGIAEEDEEVILLILNETIQRRERKVRREKNIEKTY